MLIYADSDAYAALEGRYPADLLVHATAESFGTEFLSYRMAIRTVGSLEEALEHIVRYSSKHSEAIVSEDPKQFRFFSTEWMLHVFMLMFRLHLLMEPNLALVLKSVSVLKSCTRVARWLCVS